MEQPVEVLAPHDKDAEQGVLGSILHNNDAFEQVAGMLPIESFFSPGHREIFKAMRALVKKQAPIDEITLADELQSRGRLEQAGGKLYVFELLDVAPVTANVLVYAEIVLRKWQAREIRDGALDLIEHIRQTGNLNSEGDRLRNRLDMIAQYDMGVRSRTLSEGIQDFMGWMDDNSKPAFRAQWHIHKLDEKLGGISAERPTVIAARTGVGKTILLIQTAMRNALHGVPALVFNLEMQESTAIARIIAQYGDMDGSALLRKEADLFTWDVLADTAGKLKDVPFYIQSPQQPPTLEMLKAAVHYHIRNHNIGLVVIDHLARFRTNEKTRLKGSGDYEEQTARIMGLVEMMRDLEIPVLVGVQIGRSGEEAPTKSDLKGSGDIEENSQVILILHDDAPESNSEKQIECNIAKNGNGRKGRVFLDYWPYKFKMGSEEPPEAPRERWEKPY